MFILKQRIKNTKKFFVIVKCVLTKKHFPTIISFRRMRSSLEFKKCW